MPPTTRLDKDRLQDAARIAEEAVKSGTHPSAVIAVANSRELIWSHVVPGPDNLSFDTIFLVASITKPVVATAIMQLVEQGKLQLEAPVSRYLPEFTGQGKERITTWHLLTHSSGLEEDQFWGELDSLARGGNLPTRRWLYEACCRSHTNFEPGSAYRYNSLTFNVLGELIERLGGLPYDEYLQEHIFKPLGMKDTAFNPLDRARTAPVYGFAYQTFEDAFISMAQPGGGLWSTATDLIKFGQTFLRGGEYNGYRLLRPETIEMMVEHHTRGMTQVSNGEEAPFNYALGWGKPPYPLTEDGPSEGSFGHGGVTGTLLWIDPEYDLVLVFLTNRWEAAPLNEQVRGAVYLALPQRE